jgi:ABC-2 type transport system permease protein
VSALLRMEIGKLGRLASVRFSAAVLVIFPLLWAYAPGIFDVYGFFLVSGFQVPALALLSSMEFLLPLLIAITCAELIGIELNHGTLPTVLLRPVTRAQWLLAKLLVASAYPFLAMGFFLLMSLVAGFAFGYGPFVGGTGLGRQGLLGAGTMLPVDAWREILQAYAIAAYSLMPIGLLAVLFAVVLMNAAGGALATLATLIVMQLLVVFPAVTPYLLTTQLSAYVEPASPLGWVATLIAFYCAAFAAAAVIVFERKDF